MINSNCPLIKAICRSPTDMHLDFDMIERWLVMKCPLFEDIYLFALAASFGVVPSVG